MCGENADYCWSILLASSILHDVGKLVDEYIARRNYILHHQISAIIGKKALERITNNSTALKISYAILFHHEALDWKVVYKSLLSFSYLQRALSSTGKIIYTVNQNRLNEFKQNLYRILDQISQKHIITQFQHRILTETSNYAVQELENNQRFALNITRELNAAKIRDLKYLTPALALYRLLYLSDNRAASARDQYWLRLIQQVDWGQLDNVAWQISNFLAKKYYYIGLSSIPDL
ncbi:MAG: hypothetical protein QXX94_04835 [Candidatus Bathyarchaeia archaeon]